MGLQICAVATCVLHSASACGFCLSRPVQVDSIQPDALFILLVKDAAPLIPSLLLAPLNLFQLQVDSIQSDALFILLVEKDAAFMRLAEDRFYNQVGEKL